MADIGLDVLTHLEDQGDVHGVGKTWAGTKGKGKRLEGFAIKLKNPSQGVRLSYSAHIQDIGDTQWVEQGSFVGTKGQSKRLQGFAIRLNGPAAQLYDVFYQAHLQNHGDSPVVSNGAFCGTKGQSLRVEAINVWMTAKDLSLDILAHMEGKGDIYGGSNQWIGSKGQSKRLEGFAIKFKHPLQGLKLTYVAHIQDKGDLPPIEEGGYIGTKGQSKRLQGFAIKLVGEAAQAANVFYQAHLQDHGDTNVFSNGDFCGTKGKSLRVEALKVWVTPK